jgi:hypothetical protein
MKFNIRFVWLIMAYMTTSLLSVAYVFRYFVKSGGAIISGDLGDTRIVIVLLEHWKSFFAGIEEWSSPLFFYPIKGVLGNTDAHALYAPIYSVLRVLFDPYISYEMTLAFTRLLGFFFMALLLRASFRLPHWASILGATIFTILASNYVHLGHGQFVVVAYIPLLIYLVLRIFQSHPHTAASWASGVAAAVVFSALCLSTFYIAWFAVLASIIVLILVSSWAVLRFGASPTARLTWSWACQRTGTLCAMLAVLLCGAIPFCYLYLPRFKEHGGYPLEEIMTLAQRPADMVNAGIDNWIWGRLLSHGEFASMTPNFGFAPILLVMTLTGIILGGYNLFRSNDAPIEARFTFFCGIGGFVLWFLFLRFDTWTPYWLLYHFFPGATAMRAPYRITMFLGALFVPVAMFGLVGLVRGIAAINFKVAASIAIAATLMLVAEQRMIYTPGQLFRVTDMELSARISSVPKGCQSFFVYGFVPNGAAPLIEYFYAPTTEAMMIAARDHVPTLNGISTVTPNGWNLMPPLTEAYLPAVRSWVDTHGLKNVCELNLYNLTWETSPFDKG